jgi:hypothetical protein
MRGLTINGEATDRAMRRRTVRLVLVSLVLAAQLLLAGQSAADSAGDAPEHLVQTGALTDDR